MKIFSEWEKFKMQKLIELGFKVVTIHEHDKEQAVKNVTGTLVRELIYSNRNWKDYVPYGTEIIINKSINSKRQTNGTK